MVMNWNERLMDLVSVEKVFEELEDEIKKVSFKSIQEVIDYFSKLSGKEILVRKSKRSGMLTSVVPLACCKIWVKAQEDGKIESLSLDVNYDEYFYKPDVDDSDFRLMMIKDEDHEKIINTDGERNIAIRNYISGKKCIADNNIREIECNWNQHGYKESLYEYINEDTQEYMYSSYSQNIIVSTRKLQNAEIYMLAKKYGLFLHGYNCL